LAYIIPADDYAEIRMAATMRLERCMRQFCNVHDLAPEISPTRFQRQRLILLLRLIDANQAHSSRREMAYTLIYPNHEALSGAAWKGSSERRRTQRLIDEATRMAAGGYRALLQG
jgi:hypothetical protein